MFPTVFFVIVVLFVNTVSCSVDLRGIKAINNRLVNYKNEDINIRVIKFYSKSIQYT